MTKELWIEFIIRILEYAAGFGVVCLISALIVALFGDKILELMERW